MTHDTPPTRGQGENPWPIWDIDVSDEDCDFDWLDLYLFQWYGSPNSLIDEAGLIIVSDRFPIVEW